MTSASDKLAQNPWDGLQLPAGTQRVHRFAANLGVARIGQAGHAAVQFTEARGHGSLTRSVPALLEWLLGRRAAGQERSIFPKLFLRFFRFRRLSSPHSVPVEGRVFASSRTPAGTAPLILSRFVPEHVTRQTLYSVLLRTQTIRYDIRGLQSEAKKPVAAGPGVVSTLAAARPLSPRWMPLGWALKLVRSFEEKPLVGLQNTFLKSQGRFERDFRKIITVQEQAQEPLWRERTPKMEVQPLSRPAVPQASWLGVSPSAPPPAAQFPLTRPRAAEAFLPPVLSGPSLLLMRSEEAGREMSLLTARPLSDMTPAGSASEPALPAAFHAPRRLASRLPARLLAAAAAVSLVQALPSLNSVPVRAAAVFTQPFQLAAAARTSSQQLTELTGNYAGSHLDRSPALVAIASRRRQEMAEAAGSLRRLQTSARQTFPEPATLPTANAAHAPARPLLFRHDAPADLAPVLLTRFAPTLFAPSMRQDTPSMVRAQALRGSITALASLTRISAERLGTSEPVQEKFVQEKFVQKHLLSIGQKQRPGGFVSGTDTLLVPRMVTPPLDTISPTLSRPAAVWNSARAENEPNRSHQSAKLESQSTLPFHRLSILQPFSISFASTHARPAAFSLTGDSSPVLPAIRPQSRRVSPQELSSEDGSPRDFVSNLQVPVPAREQVRGHRAMPPARFQTNDSQINDTLLERLSKRNQVILRPSLWGRLPVEAQSTPLKQDEVDSFQEAFAAEFQPPLLALVHGFLSSFLSGMIAQLHRALIPGEIGPMPMSLGEVPLWLGQSDAVRLPALQQTVPSPLILRPLSLIPLPLPTLETPFESKNVWTPLSFQARIEARSVQKAATETRRTAELFPIPQFSFQSPSQTRASHAGEMKLTQVPRTEVPMTRQSGVTANAQNGLAASYAPAMLLPNVHIPATPSAPADEGWAIQRVAAGSSSTGSAGTKSPQQDINMVAEEKGAAANDVHLLANEVWSLLKRRMETEAERIGRR